MIEPRGTHKVAFTIALAISLVLAGCGSESPKQPSAPPDAPAPSSGTPTIALRVDPNPPAGAKDNTVHVTVQDTSGKPISDAQVHMTLTMPANPAVKMAEMKNAADLPWTGSDYSAPVQIMMAGGWDVVVEVKRGNEVLATYKTHLEAK